METASHGLIDISNGEQFTSTATTLDGITTPNSHLPEVIDFVTMGMFIIDEIHYPPPRPTLQNILGGGGLYALYGARIFSPPPDLSRRCSMVIDIGSDFPSSMLSTLRGLNSSSIFRQTPNRLTTRGWNKYGSHNDPEYRAFKYLTPKLRIDVRDFFPTDESGGAGSDGGGIGRRMRCLHMICSPLRASKSVRELWDILDQDTCREKKNGKDNNLARPLILWEPVPDLCTPETRQEMYDALELMDIISPNEGELAGFFTDEISDEENQVSTLEGIIARTESLAKRLAKRTRMGGLRKHGAVIVRCGALGCFIVSQELAHSNFTEFTNDNDGTTSSSSQIHTSSLWLPAYHDKTQSKVIDPTGAGNAFMGGLAIGLTRPVVEDARLKSYFGQCAWLSKLVIAVAHAQVAASFAIEQVGMPMLTTHYHEDEKDGEEEKWNGDVPRERLMAYMDRVVRQKIELENII